jgi:hypothetical protein
MDNFEEAIRRESVDSSVSNRIMKPGDPLDLLKGISDLFVSYQPDFGFENTLEFSTSPRSKLICCTLIYEFHVGGWNLLSHSILNKFAPRHSIFLQELSKKKEIADKEEFEKRQKKKARQLIRKQKRLSKQLELRSKSTVRNYFGYLSTEKESSKKCILKSPSRHFISYNNSLSRINLNLD